MLRLIFTIPFLFFALQISMAQELDVWFAASTNNCDQPEGIYHATFDDDEGKLSPARLVQKLDGGGWITLHPERPVLYATGDVEGEASIVAFAIDEQRNLKPLGSQPTGGGRSCHIGIDETAQRLFSAQYGGGSFSAYALGMDGSIDRRLQVIPHAAAENETTGKRGKKKAAHPHYVAIGPENKYVLVADLGLDRLMRYKLGLTSDSLQPAGHVAAATGVGPRHMKFHPSGKMLFVVNELALSVSVYAYDSTTGELDHKQTVDAISAQDKAGEVFNSASEIRVHPSGDFVYSANRGHDSITVFAFDESSQQLSKIQNIPIRGSWPRNINLSPNGKWLLAAGADSNSVAVFAIDQKTGRLTYQRKSIFVPGAICVTFGEAR